MADRFVTRTGKDPRTGDITSLCNLNEYWSPIDKELAIIQIDAHLNAYWVQWQSKKTQILVVNGPTGKYLRTDHDNTTRNNLLDLPDC
jgi:hypothetical protein